MQDVAFPVSAAGPTWTHPPEDKRSRRPKRPEPATASGDRPVNRVEVTFVLDAESSNAAVTTADGTLTTFAGGFWPGVVVASRID